MEPLYNMRILLSIIENLSDSIKILCLLAICNSYSTVVGIYGSKPTRARGRSPEGKGGLRCHISLTTVLYTIAAIYSTFRLSSKSMSLKNAARS